MIVTIDWLHVLLAGAAGVAGGLAWGYRTALTLAKQQPPIQNPPPREAREGSLKRFPDFGDRERA